MSGPALAHEDIFAKAKELRAAGVPLAEIDAYLTKKLGPPGANAPHSKFSASQLVGRADRAVANARDEEAVAADGTPATRALGTVTDLSRDIPGAERAQAGVRSLVRRQPYEQALSDIRGAEDTAPAYTAIPARVIGTGLSTAALPGGAKVKGVMYGALRGALDADPESTGDRVANTVVGGALGYAGGRLAGRVAKAGGTAIRAGRALYAKGQEAVAPLISASRSALANAAAPAIAPVAEEVAPAATQMSREEAKSALAKLLQKNLDEGIASRDAVPASNWDLMDRMERGLVPTGNRVVSLLRPQ